MDHSDNGGGGAYLTSITGFGHCMLCVLQLLHKHRVTRPVSTSGGSACIAGLHLLHMFTLLRRCLAEFSITSCVLLWVWWVREGVGVGAVVISDLFWEVWWCLLSAHVMRNNTESTNQ